jgi:hypothetical protein
VIWARDSGQGRHPARVELVVVVRAAGQDPQAEGAVCLAAQYLGQRRGNLVVTDDQVVTSVRVEGKPGVPKVPG